MIFKIPNKILIATNNRGKFSEISQLLKSLNIEAIDTFDKNIPEPEETGKTFAENSLLKAKYYAKKTKIISLADDSGICIEAMNGEPGIYSARFAIDEFGQKNFTKAFEKISAKISTNSKAYFICNLSLFDPNNGFEISFEGRVDGDITFPPRGNKGFGYDPIFIKEKMTQTFGEIDPDLKEKISHRGIAFEKMTNWLINQNKQNQASL